MSGNGNEVMIIEEDPADQTRAERKEAKKRKMNREKITDYDAVRVSPDILVYHTECIFS